MGRTVKREPSSGNGNRVGESQQPRAVKPQRLKANQVNSGGNDSTQQDSTSRRVLRSKYLEINSRIKNVKDDLTRLDSEKFASIIKEVENLHQLVQKPREQVADAEALLGLTSTLVSSVKSQSNEGISVADFVSCLLMEFGQSNRRMENEEDTSVSIKWNDIGLAVSPIFMKSSGFRTMMGPMNLELKRRKVAIHRERTKPTERSQPEEVENTGEEQKTDTDKNMATIFEILRRKKRVRLENLILNRKSFAQTVENLFALSFLVKDGRVEIIVDDSGSHLVSPRNAPAADSVMSREVAYRHFVFRFDFKDWKLMMDMVPDGEELMPHRKSSIACQEGPADNNTEGARTPIRKLSRNRGLVLQEELIVEDSPETDDVATRAQGLRRCKRKLT